MSDEPKKPERVPHCPGSGMPPAGRESAGRGVCKVCGASVALRKYVILRAHRRHPASSMTPGRRAMVEAAAEEAMIDDGKAWYDVPESLSESEQGEIRRRRFREFFDKRDPLAKLLREDRQGPQRVTE